MGEKVPELTAELVGAGKCILFLGAGFSKGAINLQDKPIVSAVGFTDILLDACNIKNADGYDLDTAAEEFEGRFGEQELVKLLHQNFTSRNFSDDQMKVVCQPWHRIYTTNYDDLIESICHSQHKAITTKEISDVVEVPLSGVTQVVHIYGNISRVSAQEFKSRFLLTERQRDNSPFVNSAWKWRFNDDVLAAPAIVFVGFSMTDIDLRRLLGQLPSQVHQKIYFVDIPGISEPIKKRISRFGRPLLIGLNGLASVLGNCRLEIVAFANDIVPSSVEELQFTFQGTTERISSVDIEYLLIAGLLREGKLAQRDIEGVPGAYTVKRSDNHFKRAVNSARPVLVHSDIGNGKSIFSVQVAYARCLSGARAFRLRREPEQIGEVISFFQSLDERAVIIADDLSRFPSLIEKLIRLGKSNLGIIATVRSNVWESGRSLVESRLGATSVTEIDLNISTSDEVQRISNYIDENGLWGTLSELSSEDKLYFIARQCGGQLRDVVLSLFDRGSLHERVLEQIQAISDLDPFAYKLLVLSALLNVAGQDQFDRFHMIADLVEYSGSFEEVRDVFRKSGILGLVQVERGEIGFRSPAFAEFMLRNLVGLDHVLAVAKQALMHLDRFFSDDYEFDSLNRALLKFSLYGRIFKQNNLEEKLEGFYDDCRSLKIAKRDPLFLVQRSISCMSAKRFSSSKLFVETAYGMAKKRKNFDTYQIDTHNAKMLLSKTLHEGPSENFEEEAHAHSLIEDVLSRRRHDLYHPLSVLRLDGEIVKKWGRKMTPSQRKLMLSLLARANQLVKAFPEHQRIRYRSFSTVKQILERAKRDLEST